MERPEVEKINLVARYEGEVHPVRLKPDSSDQIAFFLDCRFLGFTGRCEGGHPVNPMNTQYKASLVRIQSGVIAATFEWSTNPEEGSLVVSTTLGSKSDLWHSISLESFVEFLCSRNNLSQSCKNEVEAQIQAITLKLGTTPQPAPELSG